MWLSLSNNREGKSEKERKEAWGGTTATRDNQAEVIS